MKILNSNTKKTNNTTEQKTMRINKKIILSVVGVALSMMVVAQQNVADYVKKMVEEFKGKIMVDSEFGEGTTFVISLPLIKED